MYKEQLLQTSQDYLEIIEGIKKSFSDYIEKTKEILKEIKEVEKNTDNLEYSQVANLVQDFTKIRLETELLNQSQDYLLVKLNEVYKLSKVLELDLGLNEELVKELQFTSENSNTLVIMDKGKLVYRDKEEERMIKEGVKQRVPEIAKGMFEQILSDEYYKNL